MGEFRKNLPNLRSEILQWDSYLQAFPERANAEHAFGSVRLQILIQKLEAKLKSPANEELAELAFRIGTLYGRLEKLRLDPEITTGKKTLKAANDRATLRSNEKYEGFEGTTLRAKKENAQRRVRELYAQIHQSKPKLKRDAKISDVKELLEKEINSKSSDYDFKIRERQIRDWVPNPVPTRRGRPRKD